MIKVHSVEHSDMATLLRGGKLLGIEKTWHKLTPKSIDTSIKLYDAEFRELTPSNYGITIYYKIGCAFPKVSPDGYNTSDMMNYLGRYGNHTFDLHNLTILGIPTLNFTLGNVGYSRAIMLTDEFINADEIDRGDGLVIPNPFKAPATINETDLENDQFAEGTAFSTNAFGVIGPRTTAGTQYTCQGNQNRATEFSNQSNGFLLMNTGSNDTASGAFLGYSDDGEVISYSIDTASINMNLPVTGNNDGSNKLMPLLFTPFVSMSTVHPQSATGGDSVTVAAVRSKSYFVVMCLGVTEVASE